MARVELNITVDKVLSDADLVSPYVTPMSGASVLVSHRGTGTPATIYGAETGGAPIANPLASDANGRVDGWVDPGSYNAQISGAGISTYTQPFEAVRGDEVTNIAVGAIGLTQLAAAVAEMVFKTGDIKLTGKGAADSGWLLCQGQAVSRTTYSALFAVVGTTFGVGDGSTTFNVPDLRGRTPVGPDAGVGRLSSNNALGNSGGAQTHTLITAELPSHSHADGTLSAASAGSHTHTDSFVIASTDVAPNGFVIPKMNGIIGAQATGTVGTGFSQRLPYNTVDTNPTGILGTHTHTLSGGVTSGGAHTHDVTGSTATAGSGDSHNNLQPYQVVQFQIKT